MEKLFCDWQWGAMSIKNVVSVRTRKSDKKIKGHGNTKAYQIGVKFTGRSSLSYRGENIDFTSGTVVYLPKEKSEDIDYTTVTAEEGTGVCIFFDSESALPPEPQILKNIDSNCEEAFLKLLNVYTKSEKYAYPDVMAAFYSLLSLLSRECKIGGGDDMLGARFEPVTAYMQRHIFDEYPDFERMAALAGMSQKYFRDSFKSVYGIPPLQYFHRLKLNRIKNLLSDQKLRISEVASLSGFRDANYFSRFFRKNVGISPSEYRKYYCFGM